MRTAVVAVCVTVASAYVGTPVVLGKLQVQSTAARSGSPNAQSGRLMPLAHMLDDSFPRGSGVKGMANVKAGRA